MAVDGAATPPRKCLPQLDRPIRDVIFPFKAPNQPAAAGPPRSHPPPDASCRALISVMQPARFEHATVKDYLLRRCHVVSYSHVVVPAGCRRDQPARPIQSHTARPTDPIPRCRRLCSPVVLPRHAAAPRTPTLPRPHKSDAHAGSSPHPLALGESNHDGALKLGVSPRRPTPLTFSRHFAVDRHPISKTHRRRHRAEMLRSLWWLLVLAAAVAEAAGKAGRSLHRDFDAVWGKRNARFFDEGRVVELALDRETGSRLQSKERYLFGRFDLDIRLVAGESAGTITSFYICTGGARHDEVDFEFLGNVSGEPYILHTNIFSDGKGEREQQFVLWFDPTADFHTYSILWNPLNIILYIDGTPIRVFKNNEANGVPFPTRQPVHVFASIWNAEEWATQGGRVKTDWSEAPFVAAYRRFGAGSACVWQGGASPTRCGGDHLPSSASSWMTQRLDWWSWMTLNWVRMSYMTYDYCADRKRYPHAFPTECIIPIGRI